MKRLLFLLIGTLVILLSGCKSKAKTEASLSTADSALLVSSFLLTDTLLPQTIDLRQDINKLSLQELRLLRSYPYAIHGYHFMEADINSFFTSNTNWYTNLVWELYDSPDKKFAERYEDVQLTPEEQVFVKQIDDRIAQLRQQQYIDKGSYSLGNISNIVNLFQFKDVTPELLGKLRQSNFSITTGTNLQLFHAYEENDYRQIPNFVTTDLFLQSFHTYFAYILKSLEKQNFIPTLENLCKELHQGAMDIANKTTDPALKNMAEFSATFYAIPHYLLTNNKLSVPAVYGKAFQEEIQHINLCEDAFSDFLSYTDAYFPYSLFKPRGHYTREPRMQAYFRAMMWLQTACFCRETNAQLQHAVFQAGLLNSLKNAQGQPLILSYKQVYDPINFLMGEADNLSIMDISQILNKEKILDIKTAVSPIVVARIDKELKELAKTKNHIKPKIQISCQDKINFMPQRYLADNEVLLNMADVNSNSKRAFPKGLDVFAAFGSTSAEKLLNEYHKEPDHWNKFDIELKKLKDKFQNKKPLPATVYNLWMDNLNTLLKIDKACPPFMQTPEWDLKNLNTALASWAELKHDAILYGEQPTAAECGGGGPPDPIVVGYVEPNLPFWNKLLFSIQQTRKMLAEANCLSDDLKGKTEELESYVKFLVQITQKELRGEKLLEQEYRTIEYLGSSIEYFTLSILDPDYHPDKWSLIQGPDKSIAVVADVYTRNIPGDSQNGILHVATGNANNIYVVVEIEGNLYLTRGATFSYYEFVQPLDTRLTDEEWQKMLEEKKAPSIPQWMQDIVIDKEPHVNERVFYSSGC